VLLLLLLLLLLLCIPLRGLLTTPTNLRRHAV
jgi:hypothetical protein